MYVTVALAVAACGGTSDGSSSSDDASEDASGDASGPSTGSTGSDVPSTASTSAPRAEDWDPDGVFTWVYSIDTTSFDPDKITTTNSLQFLNPLYDTLVRINAAGELEPMLAESWEILDDGNVLELHLIDGWTFHDGTPFDAEAVKAKLERSRDMPGSFNAVPLQSLLEVEVVDPHTVRLHTDGAASPLLGILSGAPGMMMSPAVFDLPGQDIAPTGGSGAFTLADYVPGDRVVYDAVDDYWDPDSLRLAQLVIRIAGEDDARLNAVLTGAADATFLRANMVDAAEAADGVRVFVRQTLSNYTLYLNTARSEFADKRVRQALNHAIDREAISALLDGLCIPEVQVFPSIYWPSSPNVSVERYPYDPDKARQLLAEAGLEDGFSFEMHALNQDVVLQQVEIIQQNLADVGIDMSIVTEEVQLNRTAFSIDKTTDAIWAQQKADADPSITTASMFLADGFLNPGGYTTAEITALHEEALRAPTQAERAEIYHELMDLVVEEAYPNITLCSLTTPFVASERVQDLEIYADDSRQFRGVSIART